MHEAMGASVPSEENYPSAASYAHFLAARLAHHDGNHRVALDELRLALASDDASLYLMTQVAEQYARQSDLDRAEAQLKRVMERSTDYAPAQLLMGRVLFEGQKPARARTHLARAIRLKPQDPDAYLVLTQLCLDQGKVDEAVKVVEDFGAAVPGDPVGYRRLGLALAERGDLAPAEKLLTRAVDRDPGDEEAWATLARIYENTNRLPRAAEAWGRALEREPENRDVLLSAGRLALRQNQPVEARAYFDALLSLGHDAESVVKVAFSYLAVRQLDRAAEVLDQARKTGDEVRLHFYAGLVHERLHAWARAAEAFADVPRSAGELYFEARLHRAMSLSSAGRHPVALEAFAALTQERPELTGLLAAQARAQERAGQVKEAEFTLMKGVTAHAASETLEAVTAFYARQGRLGDAVALYSGALGRAPRDEALLFALATALERQGDWQKAVEKMRAALEVDPQNPAALNFIGYTLADRGGDLDEAERYVRRALEARPDSPSFLDSMGWVAFKRGDLERAVVFLEKAAEEAPEEPTLLEHLGDAYGRAAKKKSALDAWGRAVRLLADNPDAADRPNQRQELERKLKALGGR